MLRIWAKAYLCGKDLQPEEVKRKLVSVNPGLMVQTVKGSAAENEFFVEMIAAQTLRAESTGNLLAKKPEIDFLLRLAVTTQISRAIREQGAKRGAPFVLIAAGRSRFQGPRELEGMELPRRSLSRAESEKVERAALLSAERP